MNQRPPPPPFAPGRISFSTDFALDQPPPPPTAAAAAARASGDADFEFSGVGSRPMMAADQLFFKGRILPFKDSSSGAHHHHHHHHHHHLHHLHHHPTSSRVTTLRDELRAHEDCERPGKPSPRWKELLGLRKPLCSPAKKSAGAAGATSATEASAEAHSDKSAQFHRS